MLNDLHTIPYLGGIKYPTLEVNVPAMATGP